MDRRAFLTRAAATAAASVAGTAAYAWGVEPHWVETTHHDLPIDRLPAGLEGATLVQVSDLHVGPRVDSAYLVRCLDAVRTLRTAGDAAAGSRVAPGRLRRTTRPPLSFRAYGRRPCRRSP